MPPPLLTLQNIDLTFGGTPLLEKAELSVSQGDRLCVVGRNGCGKSTFLKIAANLLEPDGGERFLQPGIKVSYMEQEPNFSGYSSVLEYAIGDLGPDEPSYQAEYLLETLGLDKAANPENLSGGESRRAALARVLASEPEILILDEPTNHLDIATIVWLEKELRSLNSALLLISHDRQFLSNLSHGVVWLDRGQTKRLDQGFAAFEDWRDKLIEEEEEARHKLDRKIAREEHWLTYGVTARRKRNVRRLSGLHSLREERKNYRGPQGSAKTEGLKGEASGRQVVMAENISKKFGDKTVVHDLSIKINRGDRVGFVGPNGAGKTTLIKMLIGELEPDGGTIKLGTKLQTVTLDQKRETLNDDWSLKDTLTDGRGDMLDVQGQQKHVVGYMKDFLFSPEQAGTPVSALSGGERGRLMLALALARESNLIIMDEPTNDLDLETLDLLEELLSDYKGTLLLVSHDRNFLDRVVTSTIATKGDGHWQVYAGGYTDMLSQQKQDAKAQRGSSGKNTKPKDVKTAAKPKKGQKLSYNQKYKLETLPSDIEKLEASIGEIEVKLGDPELFSKAPEKFNSLTNLLTKTQQDLEKAETEYLELEVLREEIEGS